MTLTLAHNQSLQAQKKSKPKKCFKIYMSNMGKCKGGDSQSLPSWNHFEDWSFFLKCFNFWDKSVGKNTYSNWVFKITLLMSSNKKIEIGLAIFIWKCENTSNGSKNGLESNWPFDFNH